MVRIPRFIIVVAVLLLLQATVIHRVTNEWFRPDLLCLAAVFLALEADYKGALVGALALGLLRDLGSCGRLGSSAILMVPAAAGLVLLRENLLRDSLWTDLLLVFLYVAVCGVLAAFGIAATASGSQLVPLLYRALGQATFTTALYPPAFIALDRLHVVRQRQE